MIRYKSGYFLGAVLALLGVIILILEVLGIENNVKFMFLLGVSLIFLYYRKEKIWSLLSGILVLLCCGDKFFHYVPFIGENLLRGLFFILPGIVFLIFYFKEKTFAYLITSSFSVWAGIYIILSSFSIFKLIAASLFLICFGMALVSIYIISGKRVGVWYSVGSIISFFVSGIFIIGNEIIMKEFNIYLYFLVFIMILVNVYLISTSNFKKRIKK